MTVARNLKRLEYYPNAPLPTLIRVTEDSDRDAYDMMFSYHHSTKTQLGQVKVYKNSKPVEYVSVATIDGSVHLEVIGQGEQLRHFQLPFGAAECQLPLDLSPTSGHPLASALHATLKEFPPLPDLARFYDYTPLAVTVENESSVVLMMPTHEVLTFNPECMFNVGDVPDDLIGCLFGPVGCAISVGIAVLLISRRAL